MRAYEIPTPKEGSPAAKLESLASPGSRSAFTVMGIVISIVVSTILGYSFSVAAVRAESATVARIESMNSVASHVKDDAYRFSKLEEKIDKLSERLDRQNAETNKDIKQILLEMRRK